MTTRIGLVSDSHDTFCKDWPSLLAALTDAFAGVDAILHCGDISSASVLDALAGIAPVYATRSEGDPPADPPRLQDGPVVVEIGGHRIGLAFSRPADFDDVEAVVFGGTHAASIEDVGGIPWVNPGSPSLAEQRTVAVLTLAPGASPSAEIVALP